MTSLPAARTAGRYGAPRRTGLRAVSLLVLGSAVACSSPGTPTAQHRGQYPVASAVPHAVPVASAGHYRLVAAGEPVRVQLGTAVVRAQMTGPEVDTSGLRPGQVPPTSARGVVTVLLSAESGSVTVPSRTFLALGEKQDVIRVKPDRPSVQLSPGHPQVLHLSTTFEAGHATLTWQPEGKPLVTWDFVVELD